MNRRKFLKIAGGGGVILAAGGVGFAATREPLGAITAWKNVGALYADPMRRALSYAILAPNPHNRQPWVVSLKSDTEAVLSCDLDRLLPVTDPFSRQIVIGLGCFLELFSLAAAEQNYRTEIQYFPMGEHTEQLDQRPIARLLLKKTEVGLSEQKHKTEVTGRTLFAQTLKRQTNRGPFDLDRPIEDSALQRLRGAWAGNVEIGTANTGALLASLRVLTRDAMWAEMATPDAYRESIDLMRIGRAEIEANPDGISLKGAFLETLYMVGALTRESLVDPTSSSYKMGRDMMEKGAMSAMGFVWISTTGNDRTAQIEAGRAYMRVALQVSAEGLAMQPMSQSLQEYAAMKPYYAAAHDKLVAKPGARLQMLARLGYAANTGPSPRWPLETRLKKS